MPGATLLALAQPGKNGSDLHYENWSAGFAPVDIVGDLGRIALVFVVCCER